MVENEQDQLDGDGEEAPSLMGSCDENSDLNHLHNNRREDRERFIHDLQAGDHIVRWAMFAFCYPMQIHGIVLSAGPDLVTIVDCGLTSYKPVDKAGTSTDGEKIMMSSRYMKTRRRLNILTLVDRNEINKWKKVRYGEEYQVGSCATSEGSLGGNVHHTSGSSLTNLASHESSSNELNRNLEFNGSRCNDSNELVSNIEEKNSSQASQETSSSFWPFPFRSSKRLSRYNPNAKTDQSQHSESQKDEESKMQKRSNSLRLPLSDPPCLVLARLRFLLEYAEGDGSRDHTLLPPHHIIYANSECIAVWVKTGHWSTLQASVFLHSSTLGNAKQTATLTMFLSSQTVTVPAPGIWGFFGGTTTVSLFSTQPWLVPALVGGGMLYVGLPMMVLWKAKGRWAETEKKLGLAFWERVDTALIVELIHIWSGLRG